MSGTPKAKTSSMALIKQNKDLALWRDITQTKTNKYPRDLYDRVLEYMKNNYIFKEDMVKLEDM